MGKYIFCVGLGLGVGAYAHATLPSLHPYGAPSKLTGTLQQAEPF
jgi:hypothetical protein